MSELRGESIADSPVVPIEYAGLWIAWNRELDRIIASGATFDQAYAAAIAAGEPRPVLVKAPRREVVS